MLLSKHCLNTATNAPCFFALWQCNPYILLKSYLHLFYQHICTYYRCIAYSRSMTAMCKIGNYQFAHLKSSYFHCMLTYSSGLEVYPGAPVVQKYIPERISGAISQTLHWLRTFHCSESNVTERIALTFDVGFLFFPPLSFATCNVISVMLWSS